MLPVQWFLYKIENIVNTSRALSSLGNLSAVPSSLILTAKRQGFSDSQISSLLNTTEGDVRKFRKSQNPPITPFVKRIDTLAAEYPAHTNYLYTTYNASAHDVTFDDHGTMVLGSGVYRIGSSVEFDWCAVTCARKLREMGDTVGDDGNSVGGKTIMVNYNPETVSTDFDEADRLYFEELGWERVMDIYELEGSKGVIVSVGGQLCSLLTRKLTKPSVKQVNSLKTLRFGSRRVESTFSALTRRRSTMLRIVISSRASLIPLVLINPNGPKLHRWRPPRNLPTVSG